jgi:hypothetical protein
MPLTGSFTAGTGWRKASRSVNNGACVDVGTAGAAVMVRDTADQAGPAVAFPASAWRGFLAAAKSGARLPASGMAGDLIETSLPDLHDVPLDAGVQINDSAYARIFRRVTEGDGGDDPRRVSAFNSSI